MKSIFGSFLGARAPLGLLDVKVKLKRKSKGPHSFATICGDGGDGLRVSLVQGLSLSLDQAEQKVPAIFYFNSVCP